MNYLVVVAHPDDEVLGAGATIYKLTKEGHEVSVCILSAEVKVRTFRPKDDELDKDLNDAIKILGVNKIIKGNFPNIKLNTESHLDLVQFIENAIKETSAEVIITHFPNDLNNDHFHTSIACQAASRLFQRIRDVKPLKELYFMEVLSSTEWSFNTSYNSFRPNIFFKVGKLGVQKKIEALNSYRGVMRDYPHPRSKEAIYGLAAFRGAQAGFEYAEAFECVFRREN